MTFPRTVQLTALASVLALGHSCSNSGGGDAAVTPISPELSAATSQFSANPTSNVPADGTTASTITVRVLDTTGSPMSGLTVTLAATGAGNILTQPPLTNAQGISLGAVASTVAGSKTVSATVSVPQGQIALTQTAAVTFVDASIPALFGAARFEDSDQNSAASAGDNLVLAFTLDVDASSASVGSFSLPVIGDSFGSGASLQPGPNANEVTIVLGSGAVLRSRGAFDNAHTTSNSPSGVTLAGASGIVGATSSQPASVATVDVAPALVSQGITLAQTSAKAVAVGDLDRDGDLDLWVGRDGADQVVTGDGSLGFTNSSQFGSDETRDVVILDLNRFGGADIATAQTNGIQVWSNQSLAGNLNITAATLLPSTDIRILRAVDLTRDGYPELIAGGTNGVQVWRNQGNIGLSFTLAATFSNGAIMSLDTGDYDGDGILDIAVAAANESRVYRHDGALGFTPASELVTSSGIVDIATADVDGDTDLDILAATSGGSSILFENDNATFTARDLGFAANRVAFDDQDGDGAMDVIALDEDRVRAFQNDGAGNFAATQPPATSGAALFDMVLADLDRDGDSDLATVIDQGVVIRNGSRTGTWGTATYSEAASLGNEDSLATVLGDVDGDGDLDMIAANSGPDYVWINDGAGGFTWSGQPGHTLSLDVTSSLAIGDLDRDGDLDIVTGAPAAVASQNMVWLNDGAGNFQLGFSFGGNLDALSMALGDIDGDLDLDLIVGNDGANQVWRNDSSTTAISLTLSTSQMPADPTNNAQQTNDLALIDMDRDGDLDLIAANGQLISGQLNKYYSNNGSGTMTFLRNLPGGAMPSFSVATADLDADGDLDVAIGNRGNGSTIRNLIIDGFGNGQFANQVTTFSDGAHDTRGLSAADVDGDGDIDLLAGDVGVRSFRSWLNDGAGIFSLGDSVGMSNTAGMAAGDLDGDGDCDAVTVNRNQPNSVFLNQ